MKEINTDKWGIIGHKNVVSYFKISLERHKFAHTYLFSGPAQVGKKTVVNKFIQSLICDNYFADNDVSAPCEKCPSCQQWIKNIHPDYYELELEDDKKSISIEQVRVWQRRLQHKSFLSKYKIGIINSAELLSDGAANALLKTIEEPTPNTIIILIVNDMSLLLPTIISRSQVIKFNLVDDKDIYNSLQINPLSKNLSREQLQDIAKLSFGLPGKALGYLSDLGSLAESKSNITEIINLINQPIYTRIDFLQKKFQKKEFIIAQRITDELVNLTLLIFREILLHKKSSIDWCCLSFASEDLQNLGKKVDQEDLLVAIDKIIDWRKNKQFNVSPKLFVEDLLLNI